ncbi:putative TIM-barrel fold metal-dependent hydrolase [Lachnospiraceae bacterium PM6-15]|uniref:amidohydrolase family protein n=1 Tax=Ohessyouella blattaphilus TaxID=2949333 RepID=UPI003E2B4B26
MIIDFHTHVFPDKIAERAISNLENVYGGKAFLRGKKNELQESMEKAEIDLSIVLPVVTDVRQTASVNEYAVAIAGDGLLSFGGIHPEDSNYKDTLRQIRQSGLKGIKIHPDYQGVYINDLRYKRIIEQATIEDLIIVTHAGVDPLNPKDIHATPEMLKEVITEVAPEKLVLAHLGGFQLTEQVLELLVGRNVYFDTAVILDKMSEEQITTLIHQHGADKILFGTDSPWAEQKTFVDILKSFSLSEETKARIFAGNAQKLLGV